MAIIKWSPFADMLGEDFFEDMPLARNYRFVPALDIYEDKDNIVVETPLSGIDPNKVNIEIEDNILKISGSTEKKSEVDEKNYYRKEVRSGQFFRSVALPKAVDADKADAQYHDGILKITVPKREEAKPKTISVQVK
ncbi:MAG: Hsp20/alpha crystallin family protein [Candidatus Nomurabacteria bacterium]|nr:MAG: Hsp20/alpha crystallin family protein [Candidatus Nomurabacteria bacterium]